MRGRVDHSRGEDTVSSERVLLQVGRISRVLVDHRSANCRLISHARVINALATAVKQALYVHVEQLLSFSVSLDLILQRLLHALVATSVRLFNRLLTNRCLVVFSCKRRWPCVVGILLGSIIGYHA